jgi:hypothetical protein
MRKRGQNMSQGTHSFVVEKLKVNVYPDRRAMGKAAGKAVAERSTWFLLRLLPKRSSWKN